MTGDYLPPTQCPPPIVGEAGGACQTSQVARGSSFTKHAAECGVCQSVTCFSHGRPPACSQGQLMPPHTLTLMLCLEIVSHVILHWAPPITEPILT